MHMSLLHWSRISTKLHTWLHSTSHVPIQSTLDIASSPLGLSNSMWLWGVAWREGSSHYTHYCKLDYTTASLFPSLPVLPLLVGVLEEAGAAGLVLVVRLEVGPEAWGFPELSPHKREGDLGLGVSVLLGKTRSMELTDLKWERETDL